MLIRWILIVLMVFTGAVLGVWINDRKPPLIFHSITPEFDVIGPGEMQNFIHKATRLRNCTVHIQQVLFDQHNGRHTVPDQDFIIDPGPLGDDDYGIPVEIPEKFPDGEARYRSARAYYCNPLHRFLDWPIVVPETFNDVRFRVSRTVIPHTP